MNTRLTRVGLLPRWAVAGLAAATAGALLPMGQAAAAPRDPRPAVYEFTVPGGVTSIITAPKVGGSGTVRCRITVRKGNGKSVTVLVRGGGRPVRSFHEGVSVITIGGTVVAVSAKGGSGGVVIRCVNR